MWMTFRQRTIYGIPFGRDWLSPCQDSRVAKLFSFEKLSPCLFLMYHMVTASMIYLRKNCEFWDEAQRCSQQNSTVMEDWKLQPQDATVISSTPKFTSRGNRDQRLLNPVSFHLQFSSANHSPSPKGTSLLTLSLTFLGSFVATSLFFPSTGGIHRKLALITTTSTAVPSTSDDVCVKGKGS